MKNRTITIDKDLVNVLQSRKGDSTTWNEYIASLLGYKSFSEFKKFNSSNIVNDKQLEIEYEKI